jgi:hypothetical protein
VSHLIRKSFQHLYRLLTAYFAFATMAVFVAALYAFFSSHPQVAIWSLVVISSLLLFSMVFYIAPNWAWFRHYRWHENIRYIWLISKYHFRRDILDILTDFEPRGLSCHPPVMADFILYALLPAGSQEVVLADLHEIYVKRRHRYQINSLRSKLYGDLFYWKEVIRSVLPLLIWRVRSVFIDTSLPAEVRENIQDVLPFYRGKT